MGDLIGYCDRLAVAPGGSISVMVHTDQADYEASLVRLIHGDSNPAGPGFREEQIDTVPARKYPGRKQSTHVGSYVFIDNPALAGLRSFTVAAWVFPTLPKTGEMQGLISMRDAVSGEGFSLSINGTGSLQFVCSGSNSQAQWLSAGEPLHEESWYFVAAGYDAETGEARIYSARRDLWSHEAAAAQATWPAARVTSVGLPLLIGAGSWHPARQDRPGWATECFNGKLGAPLVFDRLLSHSELEVVRDAEAALLEKMGGLLARWNFSADQGTCTVVDSLDKGLHGRLVNMPMRGVTGHRWSGRESDFRILPAEYDAIHFHADDIEDAAWDVDFTWELPRQTSSGVYAVRLRSGQLADRIPFIVLPGLTGQPAAPVLVVMPTMTYLAYANLPLTPECQPGRPPEWHPPLSPFEEYMQVHPDFGGSLYERHRDGSGVCYSSPRRPIVTLRPDYRTSLLDAPRHLGADLYLIDWLEALGFEYDVATDDELHKLGASYLRQYAVVVTGSHPEYATREMVAALENYVETGGHLMYLGGNGFYWVTTVHPEHPDVIEVRRGFFGTRPWESAPGELHHSTTGALGGHWRRQGPIPNRLLGVGMASEGADGRSVGYRRLPGSFDPRATFIFEGVGADEVVGDFGLVMGGAVGDEVDRADHALGTPLEAILVATSGRLAAHYSVVLEDRISWRADREPGEARADMVYLENDYGGAVFSVSSMSWTGSLSHNHYRNNVSRITENVLRRFAGQS